MGSTQGEIEKKKDQKNKLGSRRWECSKWKSVTVLKRIIDKRLNSTWCRKNVKWYRKSLKRGWWSWDWSDGVRKWVNLIEGGIIKQKNAQRNNGRIIEIKTYCQRHTSHWLIIQLIPSQQLTKQLFLSQASRIVNYLQLPQRPISKKLTRLAV